jgi:DNA polymerase (family X)
MYRYPQYRRRASGPGFIRGRFLRGGEIPTINKSTGHAGRESTKVSDHFIDEKGRMRWRRNDEIAAKLKSLHDLLVIGGYDPVHAARYARLALAISRYPVSVDQMAADDRLEDMPGVASTVAGLLRELVTSGTCSKFEEYAAKVPVTVLDLTEIPGFGPKTVRMLYQDHGISDLESLRKALRDSRLPKIHGFGPRRIAQVAEFLTNRESRNRA